MRTRSTKRTRENLNRLPREVEATLPSWVKCTDPIPREILEEVRSTVLVWIKNVRNYVEETETYILNDEHTPPEIVDEGWSFHVEKVLFRDPLLYFLYLRELEHDYVSPEIAARFGVLLRELQAGEDPALLHGVGIVDAYRDVLLDDAYVLGDRYHPHAPGQAIDYADGVGHTGWSRFIRQMILSDVNILHLKDFEVSDLASWAAAAARKGEQWTDIVVGSRKESAYKEDYEDNRVLRLTVIFHDRLSSEIKDEICSKLASALRALKSRISRICGINELERRTK